MGTPDKSIPQELLEKSHCIVLVPGLKKAALGFGGKFGRGFALCRAASGEGWGPPAALRVEGGSVGFQIGVSSSDVVMLVMNQRGMEKLSPANSPSAPTPLPPPVRWDAMPPRRLTLI